jgi:hypothetical protein
MDSDHKAIVTVLLALLVMITLGIVSFNVRCAAVETAAIKAGLQQMVLPGYPYPVWSKPDDKKPGE